MAEPGRDDADWARDLRETAAYALDEMSPPTGTEEDWRFCAVERLGIDTLRLARSDLDVATLTRLAGPLGPRSGLVATTPAGLHVLEDGPFEVEALSGAAVSRNDVSDTGEYFAALNARHFGAGALVRSVEATSSAPLVIVHAFDATSAAFFPRVRIEIAPGHEAAVVELWVTESGTGDSLVAPVTEIRVAGDARLDYAGVQRIDAANRFVGSLGAKIGQGGRLTTAVAALGGDVARMNVEASLAGEGAEYEALGVYVGDADRNVDFRTLQDHRVGHTSSRLDYRGAVWDSASSIYSGLIHIDPQAAHSDADQSSRYLILSDDARAASIPNLQIHNHDVRCKHASAGGPPDEDQIYYLATRGIAPDVATRLIVDGFFSDLIERFPIEGVRYFVADDVQRRVSSTRGAAL